MIPFAVTSRGAVGGWAALPGDDRPLPSVAAYDQLLGRESS